MQKEIKFSGLNVATNGRLSADGAMGEVMNFVPGADGMSIATLPPPQDHGDGNELMCVHHLPDGGVKYIYRRVDEGTSKRIVGWKDAPNGELNELVKEELESGVLGELQEVISLGNTIVLQWKSKMSYALWRGDKNTYEMLGERPPMTKIQFGLKGVFASYPEYKDKGKNKLKPDDWKKYDSDDASQVGQDGWIVWNESFYKSSFPCPYQGYESRVPYRGDSFSAESLFQRVTNNDDNDDNSDANGENTASIVLSLTNLVMGAVNKFIVQQGSEKNRFVMPFLVRYAYRMFDNTHIMQSVPVLMIPNSKAPVVWWRPDSSIQGRHSSSKSYARREPYVYARVSAMTSKLMMRKVEIPFDLWKWRDIIQGIDVYVSQPLYTFEQDKPVYGWDKMWADSTTTTTANWKGYFSDGNIEEYNTSGAMPIYAQRQWYNIQSKVYTNTYYEPKYKFSIKERSEADIAKDVKECSTFFKVSSIRMDKLVWEEDGTIKNSQDANISRMAEVEMEEGLLNSLTSQEKLDDDYNSHYNKSASAMYVYNNRLNMGDVSEEVNAEANNCLVAMPTNFIGYSSGKPYFWKAEVELIKNGKSIFVRQPECDVITGYDADYPRYVFVPDADAKRVYLTKYLAETASVPSQPEGGGGVGDIAGDLVIKDDNLNGDNIDNSTGTLNKEEFNNKVWTDETDGTQMDSGPHKIIPIEDDVIDDGSEEEEKWYVMENSDAFTAKNVGTYVVELEPHEFLNGAVWFKGYNNNLLPKQTSSHDASGDNYSERVNYLNKIYTSNAANPFKFEPANINTIGTGRIMAMRSAVTPVRANQVGQLSMYAFSEDGVWAMKVSGTTGGWSGWEIVNGDVLKDPNSICQMDNAVAYITNQGVKILQGSESACMSSILDGENHGVVEALAWANADKVDEFLGTMVRVEDRFEDYCDGAGLAYDYTNQRLICFHKNYRYYYIYNIASPGWGCALAKIYSAVNDYPSTWINCNDIGKVAELSAKHDDRQRVVGYMLTRAIKFDAPDAFKTITDLIVRGNVDGRILEAVLLLGSRDLINWQVVSATSHRVRAMHGSAFKYFKLLIKGEFPSWAKIDGFTAEVTSKLGNKLR